MKPYHRPFPNTWWLRRRPYFLYMMRELTSLFIAGYCILLLVLLYKLEQGPKAYEEMLELFKLPGMIALHGVALLFAIYHSITWFNLTPKVLIIQIGEERIPGFFIAGAHYVMWLAASGALLWLFLNA